MHKTIIHVFLVLLAITAKSQPHHRPIRFTNYTIKDGLPSNIVNHVMEDSHGFIWMGTSQGLARFDGRNFKVYRHSRNDSTSMPFDNVSQVIELNNKEIIFRSNHKIWMLNPVTGKQSAPPSPWSNRKIIDLVFLRNDLIVLRSEDTTWFADHNLRVFDSVIIDIKAYCNTVNLGGNRVLFSNNTRHFCYSLNDQVLKEWKIDLNGSKEEYGLHAADTVNKIVFLANYLSGINAVSYDEKKSNYLKLSKEAYVRVKYGICGSYWDREFLMIPTYNGLVIKKADGDTIECSNIPAEKNTILPETRYAIYKDRQGNYWSTGLLGVSYFSLHDLQWDQWQIPKNATIQHYGRFGKNIYMADEAQGSRYLNTITDSLHLIDSNNISYCWGAVPVNDKIYIHGNSELWKHPAFVSKLMLYDTLSHHLTKLDFLQPFYHENAELVTLVYQSKNGDVWYSINFGNGLVRQKAGTNQFTQYWHKDNHHHLSFGYVSKAAEDDKGNIYFTVNKSPDILVWLNQQQTFRVWKPDSLFHLKGAGYGPLRTHMIDHHQNLWVSYEQLGLIRYNLDNKNTRLYEMQDGLPDNIIDNLEVDADDNLWFPCVKGICCKQANTENFILFAEEDGLPQSDFQNSYLYFDPADSSMYVSKPGRLYRFKSYELLRIRKAAKLSLLMDGLSVNARPYSFVPGQTLLLGANENNLHFTFALIDQQKALRDRKFEYLLIRGEARQDWEMLDENASINLYGLRDGNYSLQMRIFNPSTGMYISSDVFRFTIARVWYQTWWFRLLLFLIVFGAVFLFVRTYYLRKLEKQQALLEKERALESERQRIAADMHDDVGAGLSRIRYITHSMKEGSTLSAADIDKILSLSDESVEKMNEIIWSLNQGNQSLPNLIYYIREQCAEMVLNAQIHFESVIPDQLPDQLIDWNVSRNLFLLVKEAVNNAIKHAGADIIRLEWKYESNLSVIIEDNGSGFDPENPNRKGNGLHHYQKRCADIHGQYRIDAQPGRGTRIQFTVAV